MAKNNAKPHKGKGILVLKIIFRLAVAVLLIGIAVTAARTAYHAGYEVFDNETMDSEPGTDVVVTVSEGMSDGALGELLESKGLIRHSYIFRIQAFIYKYDALPGTYLLNTSETVDEMMEIMTTPSAGTTDSGSSQSGTEDSGTGDSGDADDSSSQNDDSAESEKAE